jgi:hypothetical protein
MVITIPLALPESDSKLLSSFASSSRSSCSTSSCNQRKDLLRCQRKVGGEEATTFANLWFIELQFVSQKSVKGQHLQVHVSADVAALLAGSRLLARLCHWQCQCAFECQWASNLQLQGSKYLVADRLALALKHSLRLLQQNSSSLQDAHRFAIA